MRQNSGPQVIPPHATEPAHTEKRKHSRFFIGSCVTSIGCLGLLIFIFWCAFRIIMGSSPAVSTTVPQDLPKDIPQLHANNLIKAVTIEASAKRRAAWVAAVTQRYMFGSLFRELDPLTIVTEEKDGLGHPLYKKDFYTSDSSYFLSTPLGNPSTKTAVLTWSNLQEEAGTLTDEVENRLHAAGYATNRIVKDARVLNFSKDQISGTFRALDLHPDQPGAEFAELIVNYPQP